MNQLIPQTNLPTNKDIRLMLRPPEQTVITNYICERIRKGLGVNIIVIGTPGSGKSYCCLRLMELCLKDLYDEPLENPKGHVVDNIADAFGFVRRATRVGMPLTIEEISILASARRSMSGDNVSLNQLLDTVRKKQIVLLMNAPTLQSVDSHVKRMSHLMIECLRVNKQKQFATIKALKLQFNQSSGKVYTHRFHSGGRDVMRSVLYKPSPEVCVSYEEKKDQFLHNLYEMAELKSIAKRTKMEREFGAFRKKGTIVILTDKEERVVELKRDGKTYSEMARILGKGNTTVRETYLRAEEKLKRGGKLTHEKEKLHTNPTQEPNYSISIESTKEK